MARYSAAEEVAEQSRRVERVYGFLARVYDDFFDWALGPGRRHAVSRLSRAGRVWLTALMNLMASSCPLSRS